MHTPDALMTVPTGPEVGSISRVIDAGITPACTVATPNDPNAANTATTARTRRDFMVASQPHFSVETLADRRHRAAHSRTGSLTSTTEADHHLWESPPPTTPADAEGATTRNLSGPRTAGVGNAGEQRTIDDRSLTEGAETLRYRDSVGVEPPRAQKRAP